MTQIAQRNFTGGEIAPSLRSRTDLTKYTNGLARCENFFVRAQGGAYSRPGFRFIGEIGNSAARPRLIPFSFNTEQTYILVFENQIMRVIKDGGFVLTGGGAVFTLATPYTTAQLSRLSFTQSADVMTIVHPSHDPRELSRTDHNAWTLSVINFASSVTAPTISAVGIIGSGAGTYNKFYRYVVTAVKDGVESLPSAPDGITTPSLTQTAGTTIDWGSIAGVDYYRVYKDPSRFTNRYGWIGDSTLLQFSDFNIAPVISDAPPEDRQPFAGADNKPAAVNYYQQRLVFGNTKNEPQTVFTSQTGIYNSFRVSRPTRDDDAITFALAGRQVNEIRHIISIDGLVLGTSGGIWRVTEGQEEVLTPSSVGARLQSYNGMSWVPPVVIGDSIVFVQEKGSRVRDIGYQFTEDKFAGNDVSLMAEHLFESYTIDEMTYAEEPYSIVWCVRSDGVLLGMTYQKEHQVSAWHQHKTDGFFESVATITEDGRDAVYVVVRRTINGNTVRYVERMEPRLFAQAEDSFCVDSGLTYTGAATDSVSGLDHLEGETVSVLADGVEVSGLTVTGGAITLPRAYSTIHVGLPYTPVIETLDIDTGAAVRPDKAKEVSVSKVIIEVEKSRGGWVGPINNDGTPGVIREIKPRFDSDAYDAIDLRTWKEEIYIEPQWSKGGGLRIEQRSPLPLTILSVTPNVDTGG